MAPIKCCVVGCSSTTNKTHRFYNLPKDDKLRALWLSFLVPVNSELLVLSKDQLVNKRVCQKHFDRYQLDDKGNRLKDGYPCLFSAKEIKHGVPLSSDDILFDHNYCKMEGVEEKLENPVVVQEHPVDHLYSKPATKAPKSVFCFTGHPICASSSSLQAESTESDPSISVLEAESSANKVTSNSKYFIKKIKKMAKEENKTPKPFWKKIDAARKLSRSQLFNKKFSRMSQQAQDFLLMQLKMANTKKKARRYTKNEKILSLCLMKESPKGYRLLQKIFSLPTKRTLNCFAENIQLNVGINDTIFRLLKHKTAKWDRKKKLCSILFDEVTLTPHLSYVEAYDEIRGFKDFGYGRELKFCDHALVFMLKGICSNWRQPIAFYFSEGTTSAGMTVQILKEVVTKVIQSNLIPLAVVCDQGPTFRSAIKMMQKETEQKMILKSKLYDGTVNISGLPLSVVYDPPHLLKSLRNNFLTKDLVFKGEVATWKDIESVYNTDCQLGHTRMHKRLTDHHIYADKMKKMKVGVAAQALSATTSAMLKYTSLFKTTVSGENVSKTMATTGKAVEFIDNLFDSVNGSRGSATKGKLRGPVKQNTPHFNFWIEAKHILKEATFIDINSKKARKYNKMYKIRVPTLNGWITSIESFERLSKLLFEKYDIQYFYPRNINQDPLENFFGRIRAINYRNVNPDTNTFINAFKSLLMSNVMGPHSAYGNCETDEGDTVIDFLNLISSNVDKISAPDEDKENVSCGSITFLQKKRVNCNQAENATHEKIRVHSSAYTAGYVCRRVTKRFNCKMCSNTYIQKNKDIFHTWIEQREYNLLKHNNLTYPSKKFLLFYRDISGLIHEFLNKYAYKQCIKQLIKNEIVKKINMEWLGCKNHSEKVTEYMLNIILRIHIHNWCNILNKILKGDVQENVVKKMCEPQQLAFEKYKAVRLRGKKYKNNI